ncbi:MAG: hypothetical protein R3C11_24020 [Planctomycetaceae bacterium]
MKAQPENADVQKQLITTVQAAATADKAVADAIAAVKNAEAAIAEAQTVVAQAEANKQELARDVVRESRAATIAWNTLANVPAIPRLARSLYLSVIDEPAPYQIKAADTEITLYQGQQYFLPLEMAIGTPLTGNVELVVNGLDSAKQKVTADPVTLTKDQTAGHFRFYIAPDAPAAEYLYYLKSKSTFGYRKHLARLQALQAKQTEQTETINQSDAALKAAVAQVEAMTKAVADATTAKTTADQNLVANQQKLKELQTALTQAQTREKEYLALQTELSNLSKSAKANLDRIALLAKNANNEELANSLSATSQQTELSLKQLQQAVEAATNTYKLAQANSTNATKEIEGQNTAIATAEADVKAAQQKVAEAETNKQAAVEAQQKADADLKAAQAAKADIDAQVKAAEEVSKPANVEIYPPSNHFKITIKPAPAKLAATVADSGQLKQGGEVAVKVNVTRTESFKGPVKLELALPPGITGLTSEPVELAADQTEATLTLKAAADRAEGDLTTSPSVVRQT